MKGKSAMFSFLALCVISITCLNIKQNIGHAWLLGPHTLGKLIFLIICLSVKQNIDYAWLLKPHALGKLTLSITCLNIK